MTGKHRKRSTHTDPDIYADDRCGTGTTALIVLILTVGAVGIAIVAMEGVGRWLVAL